MTQYKGHAHYLVAVDCIIFGFDGEHLKLLLIKRGFAPQKNRWSLMGGFVEPTENLDGAAKRILHQLTGLKGVYLEQLRSYGHPKREPEERTISVSYFALIDINKYKEKKIEIYISGGPTYTISRSSLQPSINNNGVGFAGYSGFTIYLPGKFQIGTNDSYEYTPSTQSFNNDFSKLLINASIVKTFLKNENLKFTIWGNDLLNQNVGFSRTANANMIIQNSYTTIRRYVMFTIDYDFTKMAVGAKK